MPFSERDWKHLRQVHDIALERFCTRVLDEVAALAGDGGRSAHARYLALFQLVHERNAEMAAAFDDLRRSTALHRLSAMVALGVLTREELGGFAPDVESSARDLGEILSSRRPATRRRHRA